MKDSVYLDDMYRHILMMLEMNDHHRSLDDDMYRHKETKQSTPPAQNSFWKIKKMIIIREKKRAAGFRFAPKSVLTFHATLKQEGICVQNLRMLASTQYEHRHRPPLSCAWQSGAGTWSYGGNSHWRQNYNGVEGNIFFIYTSLEQVTESTSQHRVEGNIFFIYKTFATSVPYSVMLNLQPVDLKKQFPYTNVP